MQSGLEYLKTINIRDIHVKTHISYANIEAILNKSYSKLERVNLTGFISILQREYAVDLSDFLEEFEQYRLENAPAEIEKTNIRLNYKSKKRSKRAGWILLLLLTIALGFFYSSDVMVNLQEYRGGVEVNDSQIDKAKGKLQENDLIQPYLQNSDLNSSTVAEIEENSVAVLEENISKVSDLNQTDMNKLIKQIAPEVQNEAVTIIPIKKVWIGMIELPSMKKINRVTMRKVKVDTTKDWLIVFGHAQVTVKKEAELLEFKKRGKIYFIYKDGRLTEITKSEFKEHNRGKLW
ncbi:MAG: hypothetical protein U9P71_01185 [Campylobacterota bacterium]|nr:hypothetical protein [Campylobacterota bacterium]